MKMSIEELQRNIIKVLLHYNIKRPAAKTAAEVMIEGHKKGYYNHGVDRIFQVIEGIRKGSIHSNTKTDIIKNNVSITLFDANFGLGYDVAKQAMLQAIRKASKNGVGVSGVVNASHIGILSYYTELASKQDCIGIALSTSSPAVVLKGGKTKIMGTNPISFSLPSRTIDSPITADFSTSNISRGTLYEYLKKGLDLSVGWAVDEHGISTTNPLEALKGGLCDMGNDFKGFLVLLL